MAEGSFGHDGNLALAGFRAKLGVGMGLRGRGEVHGGEREEVYALAGSDLTGGRWRPKLPEMGRTAASGRVGAGVASFGFSHHVDELTGSWGEL